MPTEKTEVRLIGPTNTIVLKAESYLENELRLGLEREQQRRQVVDKKLKARNDDYAALEIELRNLETKLSELREDNSQLRRDNLALGKSADVVREAQNLINLSDREQIEINYRIESGGEVIWGRDLDALKPLEDILFPPQDESEEGMYA